jgi:hypothetical protein
LPYSSWPIRLFGEIALRTGKVIVVAALVGGMGFAAYAIAAGLHALVDGQLLGEKQVLERLALIPIGAVVAGGVAALPGVFLTYLGDRAIERHRRAQIPAAAATAAYWVSPN